MAELDEPEILDGMRGLADAQAAFQGVPDPTSARYITDCGWYDTDVDEHEGFFCLVQADTDLEDLIGDVALIRTSAKSVLVYCVGATGLPTQLALARTAFVQLAALSDETIPVQAQAVLRASE